MRSSFRSNSIILFWIMQSCLFVGWWKLDDGSFSTLLFQFFNLILIVNSKFTSLRVDFNYENRIEKFHQKFSIDFDFHQNYTYWRILYNSFIHKFTFSTYFLFLFTSFTVVITNTITTKNPINNCHQFSMIWYFKMTVKTTKNKIKVAISLACLSFKFFMAKIVFFKLLSWTTFFQHQKW